MYLYYNYILQGFHVDVSILYNFNVDSTFYYKFLTSLSTVFIKAHIGFYNF